jgi:RNA polymerase sigma-70 factor (ECF subfamily)
MLARSAKADRFVSLQDEEAGLGEEALGAADDDPHGEAERSDLRRHLDAAIEKLPPDYRAVFALRDIEGQSTEETAQVLGLSVAAVKSRLHRARAFLREELAPLIGG